MFVHFGTVSSVSSVIVTGCAPVKNHVLTANTLAHDHTGELDQWHWSAQRLCEALPENQQIKALLPVSHDPSPSTTYSDPDPREQHDDDDDACNSSFSIPVASFSEHSSQYKTFSWSYLIESMFQLHDNSSQTSPNPRDHENKHKHTTHEQFQVRLPLSPLMVGFTWPGLCIGRRALEQASAGTLSICLSLYMICSTYNPSK